MFRISNFGSRISGRAVAFLLLLSTLALADSSSQPSSQPAVPDNDPRVTPVVRAYQKVRSAVVNIATQQIVNARMGFGGAPDMFDDIFPSPFVRRVPVQTLGSGVVIHPSGYIITNAHVVRRAEKIEVGFADGRKFPARVISAVQQYDLAVLKVEANVGPLPYLPLGRSDDILIGETVIAVGNPFGFSSTLSCGVVSATGRDLEFENNVRIANLIQTDAPINPGNSGGPLLNIKGELVGITTAIRADAQSIGFAIPVDTLAGELADLLDFERLNRVVFGASVSQRHGPAGPEVYVTAVRPNTPAAGAGLAVGDCLAAVNDVHVAQIPDYACAMVTSKAGDKLHLAVVRGKEKRGVDVTLLAKPKPDGKMLAERLLGATFKTVDAETAKNMRLPIDRGLVVVEVEPKSPAALLGLQPRDVLFQVDRLFVANLDDLGTMLEDVKGEQTLQIGIIRGNYRVIANIRTRKVDLPPPTTRPTSRPVLQPSGDAI